MQSVETYLSVFDLRIIVRINAKCGVTMSKETASNFFAECESGGGVERLSKVLYLRCNVFVSGPGS